MLSARHDSAGFTLTEVLIALLVLSVGMLGIAATLIESLRASRAGIARTQAVTLASDIADRIRANRTTTDAYDCDGPCDTGEGGNAVAIADLAAWRDAIATLLPDGTASLSLVPGTPGTPTVYQIEVNWHEGGATTQLAYRTRVDVAEAPR